MKRTILMTIGLATLLASVPQAYSQEQLAKSMQDVRAETILTSEQLKATLRALNGIAEQKKGDLRPAFNTFAAEVTNTATKAAITAARVKWMDEDGQNYFKEWQNTITSVANESLRKKAQERLEEVRGQFDEVKKELKEASSKFKPFLSDLSDIQKTVAMDVTADGVKAARSTIKSANRNHNEVNKAISSAIDGLGKMEKALSPDAKK